MTSKMLGAYACAVLAVLVTASPASAKGVTLIQQKDGTVKTYANTDIRLVGQTLTLRSNDGKGVLTVTTGACSFAREIERCLPYTVTLAQGGERHKIGVSYGNVLLNLTDTEHHLSLSSDALAPHTALVLIKTEHGTYITVKGSIDGVKP